MPESATTQTTMANMMRTTTEFLIAFFLLILHCVEFRNGRLFSSAWVVHSSLSMKKGYRSTTAVTTMATMRTLSRDRIRAPSATIPPLMARRRIRVRRQNNESMSPSMSRLHSSSLADADDQDPCQPSQEDPPLSSQPSPSLAPSQHHHRRYDIGAGKNLPASNSASAIDNLINKRNDNDHSDDDASKQKKHQPPKARNTSYDLGVGKNEPSVVGSVIDGGSSTTSRGRQEDEEDEGAGIPTTDGDNSSGSGNNKSRSKTIFADMGNKIHWNVPQPVQKPNVRPLPSLSSTAAEAAAAVAAVAVSQKNDGGLDDDNGKGPGVRRVRRMVARTEETSQLRGAIWHEEHYTTTDRSEPSSPTPIPSSVLSARPVLLPTPELFYGDIDLSIPKSVYGPQDTQKDIVWDLLRWEAYQECQREPLLVSFLYSSILNHDSLESSLAFLLANKLSSPAMISTQVQSLILEALDPSRDPDIGRAVRADIMAVRDRDPACTCLPDVFLYFKGFHALQTYRVAHSIWMTGKHVLARYLQSQMSQKFQIDIHPAAQMGTGIMLDHGTGIVIGETSRLGHNCSILHHVTLGGSGKKGVDRHPKLGDGVLLGAGASILGNVTIGDGCQVGAGGLVITDLPPHSVAVGVPVKIIGSFVDVTEQPSLSMNQMMTNDDKRMTALDIETFQSEGI